MKNYTVKRTFMACVICLVFILNNGCIVINIDDPPMQGKYEQKIELSAPMSSGESLRVDTDGSIAIEGKDVMECCIIAIIIAHAENDMDAQRLAEKTKVELLPVNGRLEVIIEKPQPIRRGSVCINLDASVPNQADLDLTTQNGHVNITDVTGNIRVKSYNGKIITEKTSGDVQLETYNGYVSSMGISGKAQITAYNGNLKASYSGDESSICDLSMKTYNGSIEFISSPGFSAMIDAATQHGSIKTDLPITATGKTKKNKLSGTLGSGHGRLYLASYNGSIKIK